MIISFFLLSKLGGNDNMDTKFILLSIAYALLGQRKDAIFNSHKDPDDNNDFDTVVKTHRVVESELYIYLSRYVDDER